MRGNPGEGRTGLPVGGERDKDIQLGVNAWRWWVRLEEKMERESQEERGERRRGRDVERERFFPEA